MLYVAYALLVLLGLFVVVVITTPAREVV